MGQYSNMLGSSVRVKITEQLIFSYGVAISSARLVIIFSFILTKHAEI